MKNLNTSALLSLFGIFLVWPHVQTSSAPPPLPQQALTSPPSPTGDPRVGRLSMEKCDSSLESYCLNHGECMLLLDLNEHHCRCERGYHGPRCAHLELVIQPTTEEHVIVTVVCVGLLIIGLAGALYFFCKWYKKNRCPPQQKQHQGAQTA